MTTTNSSREGRAYEWIRAMTEHAERFAGSAAERTVAERIGGWMRELGIGEVVLEPAPSAPRAGLWIGHFAGAALAVLALWSFHGDMRRRRPRLARLLTAPGSVNVVGRSGAVLPARRIVLSAHIDSAQAGLLFSKALADTFAGLAGRRSKERPPLGPLALPEALQVAAALAAVAAWLGVHGTLFSLVVWIISAGLLLQLGLTLQWATSPPTPGANDNASAVAAMLTCAEHLAPQLPADTELWIVGTGAEEVGCCGMRGFVERHGEWPADATFFINFECVGGGHLHYIRSEGLLAKGFFPPRLNELAREVAAGGAHGEITPTDLLAATDGHVPASHGYPTLSLISLEANGVPRNYHRVEDTVDALDMGLVIRAADFGAAVALAALAPPAS
jgi:hypothetical protein